MVKGKKRNLDISSEAPGQERGNDVDGNQGFRIHTLQKDLVINWTYGQKKQGGCSAF